MNRRSVLVVDDDKKTVELIRLYLEKDGYRVLTAYEGRAALELARTQAPDLMVLDLMLPHVDGLDICQTLRAESDMPILMLTARVTEEDKLIGLDAGADDYLTKPFSPRELLARVRAVLRRSASANPTDPSEIRVGELQLDIHRHEARLRGQLLALTPKEFNLLVTLAGQPGKVFTRLELVEQALGPRYEGMERTIDVHLMNLRRKIENDPSQPRYIQTVYGIGYKFGDEPYVA
jgi:DNA-binding response OmpR family regulator